MKRKSLCSTAILVLILTLTNSPFTITKASMEESISLNYLFPTYGYYPGLSGIEIAYAVSPYPEIIYGASTCQTQKNSYINIIQFDPGTNKFELIWNQNRFSGSKTIEKIFHEKLYQMGRDQILIVYNDNTAELLDRATRMTLKEYTIPMTNNCTGLEIFDYQQDGDPDLAVLTSNQMFIYDIASGNSEYTLSAGGEHMAVGQMDSDSTWELVISDSSYARVYDTATWTVQWDCGGTLGDTLCAADFDGDTKDEFAYIENNFLLVCDVDLQTVKYASEMSYSGPWIIKACTFLSNSHFDILAKNNSYGRVFIIDGESGSSIWDMYFANPSINDITLGYLENSYDLKLLHGSGNLSSSYNSSILTVTDTQSSQTEWMSKNILPPYNALVSWDIDGSPPNELVSTSLGSISNWQNSCLSIFNPITKEALFQEYTDPNGYMNVSTFNFADIIPSNSDIEYLVAGGTYGDAVISMFRGLTQNRMWHRQYNGAADFTTTAIADIDNDGENEVIAGNSRYLEMQEYMSIWIFDVDNGNLDHKFQPASNSYGAIDNIEIGDIDNNGILDIGAQIHGQRIAFYDGIALTQKFQSPINNFSCFHLQDIDSSSPGIEIIYGKKSGYVTAYSLPDHMLLWDCKISDLPIDNIVIQDLDQSGEPEIIAITNGQLMIVSLDGYIYWTSRVLFNSLSAKGSLLCEDWDGDGLSEIVVGSDTGLYEFIINGSLPTPMPSPTATPPLPPSPTPSPTPTRTPTPTPYSTSHPPTPTATPYQCNETGISLVMPAKMYTAGMTFYLDAMICNKSPRILSNHRIFVILDIANMYWFAPSWKTTADSYILDIPEGSDIIQVLEPFQWPGEVGAYNGIRFWGAITDSDIITLIGKYDYVEFGYM